MDVETAKIYKDGIFMDTHFSKYTKPLIIVGSGLYPESNNTPIGENIADALTAEKIDFIRSWVSWPKDDWIFSNGVYIPDQKRFADNNSVLYSLGEGGEYVLGDNFCLASSACISDASFNALFIEEVKKSVGVENVYILPWMGHKHIDLTIGYIPWKNLFVFDPVYFRMNNFILESLVKDLNADLILAEEPLAANIFVYDYSTEYLEDRFVVTYAAPKTSRKLRKNGINVIEPKNADESHLKYFGGASCAMNTIISPSLLPILNKNNPNEEKRIYLNNPHF